MIERHAINVQPFLASLLIVCMNDLNKGWHPYMYVCPCSGCCMSLRQPVPACIAFKLER